MLYTDFPSADQKRVEENLRKILFHVFENTRHAFKKVDGKDPLYQYVIDYAINTLLNTPGIRCDSLLETSLSFVSITYKADMQGHFETTVTAAYPGGGGDEQKETRIAISFVTRLPTLNTEVLQELLDDIHHTATINLWPLLKEKEDAQEPVCANE